MCSACRILVLCVGKAPTPPLVSGGRESQLRQQFLLSRLGDGLSVLSPMGQTSLPPVSLLPGLGGQFLLWWEVRSSSSSDRLSRSLPDTGLSLPEICISPGELRPPSTYLVLHSSSSKPSSCSQQPVLHCFPPVPPLR